jgi:hypothetical protein
VTVIIITDTSGSERMLGLTLVDRFSVRCQCVGSTDVDDRSVSLEKGTSSWNLVYSEPLMGMVIWPRAHSDFSWQREQQNRLLRSRTNFARYRHAVGTCMIEESSLQSSSRLSSGTKIFVGQF